MALLNTPLDLLSEAHIRRLIEERARESEFIDYKRDTYSGGDGDRAEFAADISSFANSSGGDLVIGITETGGVPTEVAPFMGDADAELRRLLAIARDGINPRLHQLATKVIPIASGGHVLVLRAERSLAPPHQVSLQKRNTFWVRDSTGKFRPDVDQLRRLFNSGPEVLERLRRFRTERLAKITADDTPIELASPGRLVVHVAALPAVADDRFAEVMEVVAQGTHVPLPLSGVGPNRAAVNIDGFINFREGLGQRRSYAQLFRCGVIEGLIELSPDETGTPYLSGPDVANTVVGGVQQYMGALTALGAGAPLYTLVSLVGVQGAHLRYGTHGGGGYYKTGPYAREQILLPEVLLDPAGGEAPVLVRPALNVLWNAFGVGRCDKYGGDGKWMGVA
jgi:hypothetical protein